MTVYFNQPDMMHQNIHSSNKVDTSRYTLWNWAPKSLILQFRRAANIYFLIITILTAMEFSPKSPGSMIGTFAAVLFFTMLKEAWEDIARHRQDREVNNKLCLTYNSEYGRFDKRKWESLKAGEIVKILKDEPLPADIVLLKSEKESGVVFVDTMNLDGESNLKEKMAVRELGGLSDENVLKHFGHIQCDPPNEFLDKWDGNISLKNERIKEFTFNAGLKALLLRGSTLRNTTYCLGFVLYAGPESKIMMNAKKPPTKISRVQKKMNSMLYSVFAFQVLLILTFAFLSNHWTESNQEIHSYLDLSGNLGITHFLIQYLTYWVAYSHLIPISLYVVLEMVKIGQAKLIQRDVQIYDKETGFSNCKNSDLIEELGQVEFIFSDKTGTLTCNVMNFKQCSINGKIYTNLDQVNELFYTERNDSDLKACYQFFRLLAVCHSVVIDHENEDPKSRMQASSPDELALVEGASQVGFLFKDRTQKHIEILIQALNHKVEKYEVLAEFPFDSVRKRMSLLVRDLQSNKIMLMTKGADSIMIPRAIMSKKDQVNINVHLHEFACAGLRTLVMAQKEIEEEEFDKWYTKYKDMMISNEKDKEDKLNDLFDQMEQGLNYIGCSAIEDELQEEVPETISKLMDANIKIWVLTGDKQETAIEIGKSCNLINETIMDMAILSSPTRDLFESRLNKWIKKAPKRKLSIVIDGSTLTYVLKDPQLAYEFFKFGFHANSVICCRVSPKQKSDVVALAKRHGTWITLSVGDGANDVPMIMEAHIGVGIKGKEGSQASRSGDYSIGKFKFLQKLIMAHGRWGYRRVGIFICYYFYKNVLLVFCELYFALYNGYSGQIFFADWLPMLYNAFFTSWPCIFTFIYDRDVDHSFSTNNPILYEAGAKHVYFNFKIFWKWMIMALIQGFLIFFITNFGLADIESSNGSTVAHWLSSTICFTLCLHVVTYKLLLESYFWNIIQMYFFLNSTLLVGQLVQVCSYITLC